MTGGPVVEAAKVRGDLRLLWPDLHRPGLAMRCPASAGTAPAWEPSALCERIERELAAQAWHYRRMLVYGLAIVVVPSAMLGIAWAGVWILPPELGFEPFSRRTYGIPVSLYEAAAFATLASFIVMAHSRIGDNWRSMCRLGADYRYLRDADDEARIALAEEIRSGRWPRVRALLCSARVFEGYRVLMDACEKR